MANVTRSLRVDAEDWEKVKEYAQERNTTVSALLAEIVHRLAQQRREKG